MLKSIFGNNARNYMMKEKIQQKFINYFNEQELGSINGSSDLNWKMLNGI